MINREKKHNDPNDNIVYMDHNVFSLYLSLNY